MSELVSTCMQSSLGMIEIAGSDDGIASIEFVERGEIDNRAPDCLADGVRQLQEYFAGARKEFSCKLDLRGTEFQKRVWEKLLTIPFGKTQSYLDVAFALGDKKSIRAVGRANGQNPIVIVVPCHRVIGSDGSLTGYGGGLWRKEWLLNFEGSRPQTSMFDARQETIHASR